VRIKEYLGLYIILFVAIVHREVVIYHEMHEISFIYITYYQNLTFLLLKNMLRLSVLRLCENKNVLLLDDEKLYDVSVSDVSVTDKAALQFQHDRLKSYLAGYDARHGRRHTRRCRRSCAVETRVLPRHCRQVGPQTMTIGLLSK